MAKTFNYGGQRRTIKCPCGHTIVGSVREANGKHKLHLKVCVECKGLSSLPISATGFNQVQGNNNGWDGYSGNNRVENVQGTVSLEGSVTQTSVKAKGVMQAIQTVENFTSIIA